MWSISFWIELYASLNCFGQQPGGKWIDFAQQLRVTTHCDMTVTFFISLAVKSIKYKYIGCHGSERLKCDETDIILIKTVGAVWLKGLSFITQPASLQDERLDSMSHTRVIAAAPLQNAASGLEISQWEGKPSSEKKYYTPCLLWMEIRSHAIIMSHYQQPIWLTVT